MEILHTNDSNKAVIYCIRYDMLGLRFKCFVFRKNEVINIRCVSMSVLDLQLEKLKIIVTTNNFNLNHNDNWQQNL